MQHVTPNIKALKKEISRLEARIRKSGQLVIRESDQLSRVEQQLLHSRKPKPQNVLDKADKLRAKIGARKAYQKHLYGVVSGLWTRCKIIEDVANHYYKQLLKETESELGDAVDSVGRLMEITNLMEVNIPDTNNARDLFISYASEDKDKVVRPLVKFLEQLSVSIWYDEYQLRMGDSLRRSIDHGLAHSKYGLVIISPDFLRKEWTQYELDSLTAREMKGGKIILPIWHKVSKNELLEISPKLADKFALRTSDQTLEEIALHVAEILEHGK